MDEYISKPVDINELDEMLDRIQNNICNIDTNIIKSYLESNKDTSKNDFVEISKDIKMNLSNLVIKLDSYLKVEKEIPNNYYEIERIAHDIKIKCEENNLKSIKTLAFKIELAARKKDDINIQANMDKIRIIIKGNI